MPTIDTERFRLRNFVDKLVEAGECEVHNAPIDLVDVGGVLDGNPRAVLFKAAGPEKAELVGNVMASRRRLAAALDTDERGLLGTLAAAAQPPASAGQSVVAAGAGAAGRAQGRRRRPVQAAGAPAARRRRRAVYFRRHRLRAVSRHRLHQCGLPPHHAARAAAGRRRPDRAERHARHLSRSRREEGAGAGRLRGRLAPGGFSRRHDGAAQRRRARHHRRRCAASRCRW